MTSHDVEGNTVAKGNRGKSTRGNAGNRGRGSSGRTFRVIGAKKRPVGRPRKVRRPLTGGFVGARQAPTVEPEPGVEHAEEMTGDVDDVAEEERATAQKDEM